MRKPGAKTNDTIHNKGPWRCPLCEDEEIPSKTPLELLREAGVTIPPSELVKESAVRDILWDVIEALGSMGIYLLSTDHLSDGQLYALLCDDLLRQPVWGVLDPPDSAMWIDVIGGFSDDDIGIWLRHYASDDDRKDARKWNGGKVPEHRAPPFDRDRYMPRQETFWTGRWVPPPWRASAMKRQEAKLSPSTRQEDQ
jgi:hypothetical protein